MDEEQEEKLRAALDAGLARMPDDLRRCFLLRFGQGFEENEIAVLLKIPVEMVRMNLNRIRQRLLSGGGS
jgi:RNA polymerase sigma factor (sigma-70 family)